MRMRLPTDADLMRGFNLPDWETIPRAREEDIAMMATIIKTQCPDDEDVQRIVRVLLLEIAKQKI
jgi:hypothetical protein